ncbi:hypothetical protein K8I28_05330 [bacterium]|nr:hypothetical protein [bacterium]
MRLQHKLPDVKFDIACEKWQIEAMQDHHGFLSFWNSPTVTLHTGITSPGVGWSDDPTSYQDGRLSRWKINLKNTDWLQEADLVLSDNLVAVLAYRSDTILLGSFLWHEILINAYPENEAIKKFVADELELLHKYSPPMLCVDSIAMPAVLELTSPIKLPWFGEERWKKRPIKTATTLDDLKIAVAGGAIPSVDRMLVGIAQLLTTKTNATVHVNERIMRQVTPELQRKCISFDYSEEAYSNLDLLICRPGTGSLTDCVCRGIPLVAVSEPGNIEMAFNGQRIQALGYGLDAGTCNSAEELYSKIQNWVVENDIQNAGENLKGVNCEGYAEAVSWLLNYLDEK